MLLERAYETFARGYTGIPQDDPHIWLSTARMIVRFQEMRQRLTEPEHLSIADEHEDYWRVQFYDRLRELILRLDLPFFLEEDIQSDSRHF